jgi:ribosomal protein S27E
MPANRLKARYDGECPVCGATIPDDVREGDQCLECGTVFLMPSTTDEYIDKHMNEYMEKIEEELDSEEEI